VPTKGPWSAETDPHMAGLLHTPVVSVVV
jgi:hypothetical protein